jgi:hypothetical protein
VFKALALGADSVALGRPVLYGLALGGSMGVKSVYDRIKEELVRTMRSPALPTSKRFRRNSWRPDQSGVMCRKAKRGALWTRMEREMRMVR